MRAYRQRRSLDETFEYRTGPVPDLDSDHWVLPETAPSDGMEHSLLGWPPDGPALELDYREFSYAGKFVMTSTGKAVARDEGSIVGAVAFNEDRTDPDTLWFRYVSVRKDRRGEGIGPQLLAFTRDRASERGYERIRIAVNNPFAYDACYRVGFGFTGETTGIAELVLEWPEDRPREAYQAGFDEFRERDLSSDEEAFLNEKSGTGPPDTEA